MDKIDAWWQQHPKELAKYLEKCENSKAIDAAALYIGTAVNNLMKEKIEKVLEGI